MAVRLDGASDGPYEQSSVGKVLAGEELFDLREWARDRVGEGGPSPATLDVIPPALLVRLRALPAMQAARLARACSSVRAVTYEG